MAHDGEDVNRLGQGFFEKVSGCQFFTKVQVWLENRVTEFAKMFLHQGLFSRKSILSFN